MNRVRPREDDPLDRPQVEAQQCAELSGTNGRGLDPSSGSPRDPSPPPTVLATRRSCALPCAGAPRPPPPPAPRPEAAARGSRTPRAGAILASATRDGAAVAHRAHNPEVGGSNPSPATRPPERAEHRAPPVPRPRPRDPSRRRRAPRPVEARAGGDLRLRARRPIMDAPGGRSAVEPPVPIPNTEVKRRSADDTPRATGRGK